MNLLRRTVKVFYIDWGNFTITDAALLRVIPPHLQAELSLPAIAVECSLAGIQPNQTKNIQNYWDQACLEAMKELWSEGEVSGRGFTGVIYSDIPSNKGINQYLLKLSSVELYNSEGRKVEVCRWLLDHRFAESKVESYISQERAKERIDFDCQNEEMRRYLNDPNRYKEDDEFQFCDDSNKDYTVATLKGPYSPLETNVISVSRRNKYTKAKVERESVNSVLLDSTPGMLNDVWMAAAHVGITPEAKVLTLRSNLIIIKMKKA